MRSSGGSRLSRERSIPPPVAGIIRLVPAERVEALPGPGVSCAERGVGDVIRDLLGDDVCHSIAEPPQLDSAQEFLHTVPARLDELAEEMRELYQVTQECLRQASG